MDAAQARNSNIIKYKITSETYQKPSTFEKLRLLKCTENLGIFKVSIWSVPFLYYPAPGGVGHGTDAPRAGGAVGAGARRPCQEGRSGSAQRGGGEDTQRAGASQDDYEVRQQHASAGGLS